MHAASIDAAHVLTPRVATPGPNMTGPSCSHEKDQRIDRQMARVT